MQSGHNKPMYKLRTFHCTDCGNLTTRKRHSIDPRICFECGLARTIATALSMSKKSGPAYDRWRMNPGTAHGGPAQQQQE